VKKEGTRTDALVLVSRCYFFFFFLEGVSVLVFFAGFFFGIAITSILEFGLDDYYWGQLND
jgi:hypothetical protein